ncbi:ester cyclase [Nocardioides sp. DS6]|uniref:Ester cyclase n=1 Tax=Nocardioides eburneus TaxID=3231482 RepID=A0ABV3SWU1_9ACTN
MADNAEFARSIYEAWNNRDFDYLTESVAPEGTITMMGSGEVFRGPDGVRQYNTMWADAFPDGRITIDRVIAQDDCVVVEFTGRGTHTGTMNTSAGDIPATGRSATLHFIDVMEVADGKVRTQRSYFDTGALMAQLGLTAAQPATTAD